MKEHKRKRNLLLGLCAAAVLMLVITGGAVWAQEGQVSSLHPEGDGGCGPPLRRAEARALADR